MADKWSDRVWGDWSDARKASKCLLALTLAASIVGSGCAGVVMGSSATGKGSGTPAPSTPPPSTTPPPTPPPPTTTPQPQLSATPLSASFPGVTTGSSASQTITLQNAGTATVTISSASLAGAGFGASGLTLPMSVAPGQNTTFNVVFSPTSAGNVTGSISLTSNAPNSPLVISASGSATTATALLTASATNLDFGSVVVGTSSSQGVTLTNAGNANVTISNVTVTGTGFNASGAGANTTLAPGQTAALNVTFSPSATGSVAGSIAIASTAGGLSIALAGNGGQLSPHSVALNWDPSTSPVIGYYVYRMLPDGSYGKIHSAPVVLTGYTDANIQSGQTYTYVVTAVDANNTESDYSDPVLATIP
jgi:P pilus assembly chaperone PapD